MLRNIIDVKTLVVVDECLSTMISRHHHDEDEMKR